MVLEVLELRAVLDELVDLGLEARVVRREALGVGDGAGGALLGRMEPRAEPRGVGVALLERLEQKLRRLLGGREARTLAG